MSYFRLILIVFITNCAVGEFSKTDNPPVILRKSSSNVTQHFTVVADKSLNFYFENMSIPHGWCLDSAKHEKMLDKGEVLSTFPIHYNKVTYKMSTQWKCNVIQNISSKNNSEITKIQSFYFTLRVKGAKSVNLTVNSKEMTFNDADLLVPYDGDAIFFYEDGMQMQIVCKNRYSTGTVHIQFMKKADVVVNYGRKLDIILYSKDNNSFADCVYIASTKPRDIYVYRVIFIIKKQSIYLNESKTVSNLIKVSPVKQDEYSPIILGSSIGVVLVTLSITAIICWYYWTKIKNIKASYADMTYHSDKQTSECDPELKNHNSVVYDTADNEDSIDLKDHVYTEIDYLACKPKIVEKPTTNSRVYDEPYVHI